MLLKYAKFMSLYYRPKDFFESMNTVFYCSLLRSDTFCYVTEQGKP